MSKYRFLVFLVISVSFFGCSNLPNVTVVDDLADRETMALVEDSVWVMSPKHVRRFEDPAWPSPIQVIPPERKPDAIDGDYDIKLFDSSPSGQFIDVIYVTDGDEGACTDVLALLGISASSSLWVEVNGGGDDIYRCASVLLSSSVDIKDISSPLMSDYKKINFLKNQKGSVSSYSSDSKYPIKIKYYHEY